MWRLKADKAVRVNYLGDAHLSWANESLNEDGMVVAVRACL